MKRTSGQDQVSTTRTKDQSWPTLVNSPAPIHKRKSMNLVELEGRVSATERVNRQILLDISGLKRLLEQNRCSFNDASVHTTNKEFDQKCQPKNLYSTSLDSDDSMVQTPSPHQFHLKSSKRAASGEVTGVSDRLIATDKAIQKLTADLQTISSRCGSQSLDIQNLYQELKNFDNKFENILRTEMRSIQTEIPGNYSQKNQLIQNSIMNNALEQLQVTVTQLQNKTEQDASNRLKFENTVNTSLLEQTNRSSEIEKTIKDTVTELKAMLHHNSQDLDSLRQDMRSKYGEISDKLDLRVTTAFNKMEEKMSNLRTEIETTLSAFNTAISPCESKLAELELKIKKFEQDIPNEITELREDQQVHQKKLLNSLSQLDLAVEVLEQGLSDEKEHLKGVVAAEIKARTSNIYSMQSRLQELDVKVCDAVSRLNSGMDDLNAKTNRLDEDLRKFREEQPPADGTAQISEKIRELELDVIELQKKGLAGSEEVQENLKNIANAVQAVKTALLLKLEKVEEETTGTIKTLLSDVEGLREKLKGSPAMSNSDQD
uniref:Elastin microfibril interfacer 2 n=1 Tax=Mesocestoides corti TaxID=53468 RepID=A0A5K3FII7_MESCO